ncbi:MFS transporter [Roseateles sp. L2-2]|uniref:MFS transporter n=1 Tax=Roseateles sp. L2-2 TaxID=3422597 RepID=UPI003D368CA0
MSATLPASSASESDPDGVPLPRRHAAVAALLGAIALVVLDGAIANVALPNIAQTLNSSPADAIWVATAYQLAVVMFLLPASALGERLGYRRVFVAGVSLFTAASALCALAPSLGWLVAGRCLQGLGSAAVMPLGLALLRFTYPKRLLGQAIAYNALAVAGASAAGPAIGAAILSVAGWPWLFAVNLPVGLLVLIAARGLPDTPGTRRPLDVVSVALNAGMFAAFVLGGDQVLARPMEGGALLIAAIVCGALLVRRELPRAAPLIPLDLLRSPSFRMSIIASVCCFTGQMASYVALPFYMHHVLGLSVLATGLLMTPWPLAVMLAAPLSGRTAVRPHGRPSADGLALRGGGGLSGRGTRALRGVAGAGGSATAVDRLHRAGGLGIRLLPDAQQPQHAAVRAQGAQRRGRRRARRGAPHRSDAGQPADGAAVHVAARVTGVACRAGDGCGIRVGRGIGERVARARELSGGAPFL